ncbi:MAG: GNAT family N-acetyltransferase [Anaerolineae bacterium]
MLRGDSHLESDKIHKQQEVQERLEAEQRIREAQEAARSAERHFTDRKGRDMALRTEGAEPHKIRQVEAQDTQTIRHPIHLRTHHEGRELGRANLTLETDKTYNPSTGHYDRVANRRLRINDIETHPAYRGSGVGSEHIREAERIARQYRAREIYGSLSYKPEDEAAVRGFYRKHGYETRPGAMGGEEVYKNLRLDSDAANLRRQLRT